MDSKKILAITAILFGATTAFLAGVLKGKSDDNPQYISVPLPPCEPVITWALGDFPAFRDENGNCLPSTEFADLQLKIVEVTGKTGNMYVCSLMYGGNGSHEEKCVAYRKAKYPNSPD